MLEYARDWVGFAIGLLSFYLAFRQPRAPRKRMRASFRCWKLGWFEWTAYDRDDDIQS